MDRTLALQALAVIIGDDPMRDRFLALTGYDADSIRAQAGTAAMADAVAAFLTGYEPDLLQVAAALGVEPQLLAGPDARPEWRSA